MHYSIVAVLQSPESFFKKEAIVMRMCVEKEWPVETQRGALHFVMALCENSQQLPRAELEVAVEGVLKSLSHSSAAAPVVDPRPEQFSTNSVLLQKVWLLLCMSPCMAITASAKFSRKSYRQQMLSI